MQIFMDRLLLRMPVFGDLINKSVIARWTRTLSTMFAAGVPLVEALDSVGGASGNAVYAMATEQIQKRRVHRLGAHHLDDGHRRLPGDGAADGAIGEESGSLDHMLAKAAEFYEDEVDEMVKGLSSLMEPFIIVILGT
jgi:type IV pilus assembly protein PilC